MRGKASIFLIVGFVVSLYALTTLLQGEEQKAQMYFIEDVMVKTSKFTKYEAEVKEVLALMEKYKWPYPFFTYSTDDYHYYFVYPIESLADVDKIFNTWYGMVEKFGLEDKWQAIWKRMGEAHEYFKYGTCHHLPELSYAPEGYEVNLEEEPFTFWGFCYTQPGKEQKCEEIIKKFVLLFKSKKFDLAFDSYVVDMGMEMPVYFYIERGKSASDFFSKSDKVNEVAGAEIMAIWKELMAHSRKYEYKMGMFRPDLSYTPKEK